jgi:hypothetical protein
MNRQVTQKGNSTTITITKNKKTPKGGKTKVKVRPGKGRSRGARRKGRRGKVPGSKMSPLRALECSLIDPFDYAAQRGPFSGDRSALCTLYFRGTIAAGTGGAALVTAFPTSATGSGNSTSGTVGFVNTFSVPTADLGIRWDSSTSTIAYQVPIGASTFNSIAASGRCISGGLRLFPISSITTNAGIMFGTQLADNQLLQDTTPNAVLNSLSSLELANVNDGVTVLWTPSDLTSAAYTSSVTSTVATISSSVASFTFSVPPTAGLAVGVVSASSGQEFIYEAIFHIEVIVFETSGAFMELDYSKILQSDYERFMMKWVNDMPNRVIPSATQTRGAIPFMGGGPSSVSRGSSLGAGGNSRASSSKSDDFVDVLPRALPDTATYTRSPSVGCSAAGLAGQALALGGMYFTHRAQNPILPFSAMEA